MNFDEILSIIRQGPPRAILIGLGRCGSTMLSTALNKPREVRPRDREGWYDVAASCRKLQGALHALGGQ